MRKSALSAAFVGGGGGEIRLCPVWLRCVGFDFPVRLLFLLLPPVFSSHCAFRSHSMVVPPVDVTRRCCAGHTG